MLPREVELVLEWTSLPGWSVKRFGRPNLRNTVLYKHIYLKLWYGRKDGEPPPQSIMENMLSKLRMTSCMEHIGPNMYGTKWLKYRKEHNWCHVDCAFRNIPGRDIYSLPRKLWWDCMWHMEQVYLVSGLSSQVCQIVSVCLSSDLLWQHCCLVLCSLLLGH